MNSRQLFEVEASAYSYLLGCDPTQCAGLIDELKVDTQESVQAYLKPTTKTIPTYQSCGLVKEQAQE